MKKNTGLYAAAALAALALLAPAAASPLTPPVLPAPADAYHLNPHHTAYQAIVDRYVRVGLPGLAVLIKTPEEGVWIGTGGYARLEDGTPISPDSLFHSCSHCKLYTATAVMLLREEGLIDLDTPVDAYLPADISSRIANSNSATVRNLLNHTSGIPTYSMTEPWDNDPLSKTWRDELESSFDKEADFAPGVRFSYSNTNYLLLALIIDGLAGSHADFFSQRFFQPLGQTDMHYKNEPGLPIPPGLVDIYLDRFGDGYLENGGDLLHLVSHANTYGEAGLIADLEDYAAFIEALFQGRLIGAASLAEMTEISGPAGRYLFGLGIHRQDFGSGTSERIAYGHGGRGYPGSLDVFHFADSGVTICIATNYGYTLQMTEPQVAFDRIAQEVADTVFYLREQSEPPSRRILRRGRGPIRTSSLRAPGPVDLSTLEEEVERDDPHAHPHHALYQGIVDKNVRAGLPGMAMLIKTPEEGIWVGTGGFARLEDAVPITADSRFHTLGLTQLFTTTAVMMLKDEGRIDLDATIDTYLPAAVCERIANGRSATVRHLLGFTAGIEDIRLATPLWNDPRPDDTWRDDLAKVYDRPARFAPGTDWEYASVDFLLAAMIVDEVTGDHADFFSDRIFAPLDLTHTCYKREPGLPSPPGIVDVYFDRFGDGRIENYGDLFRRIIHNRAYGYGGIISTVGDAVRFMEALFAGVLVSAASLEEMTTPSNPDLYRWYGMGVKYYDQFADESLYGRAFWNGGWGKSGLFDIFHYPEAGVTICYAANFGDVGGRPIGDYAIIEQAADAVFSLR